ncbi:hypothetical protein [Nitrolancea hollandica]|uniref:Uncharacterized protein n=1 Tax=Nitrolancea hollandica Lb TaxID=1129897 RepID=I4ENI2_9BACT|nr:hypothetical protein [Nitrolancea hollandica]CCF86245.1 hypothetical protein NITHO_940003 [Nitrolancea hollandica Lb]
MVRWSGWNREQQAAPLPEPLFAALRAATDEEYEQAAIAMLLHVIPKAAQDQIILNSSSSTCTK